MSTSPTAMTTPKLNRQGKSIGEEIQLAPPREVEKDYDEASFVSDARAPEQAQLDVVPEKIYIVTLCWGALLCGWNDGTIGPLLPRIQDHYHVGYTAVSILFICGTLGGIVGSFSIVWINMRLGFGKTLALVALIQSAVYAALSPAPPFPAMCAFFAIMGYVMALAGATAQTFIACMPRNSSRNIGIWHATYALGAFVAPLVSTQFAPLRRTWSSYFLISMGMALISLVSHGVVFRGKRKEDLVPSNGPTTTEPPKVAVKTVYREILTRIFVLALAAFILVYVGIEISIRYVAAPIPSFVKRNLNWTQHTASGWIVTFLIRRRGGGPSSGYAASGFWGAEYLPESLLAGAIGFIEAFGGTGSAIFPFMTGAIASKYGVQVLQPIMVALMLAQMALWALAMYNKGVKRE
ncbi:hypothetical protein FRB90_002664 [Tulasnella sp. 427]|nr:hypothetical protein FRB90_002664 [Tulasnella sp. 427]